MMADEMERRVGTLETKVSVIETKVDQFIEEMRRSNAEFKEEMRRSNADFKEEMRQQNEMRANEIAEMRRKQDEQQARHDQNMEQLRQDVKDISKEVRNLFFAFVGIIVAIMIGMFWNSSVERNQQTKMQTQVSQATEPVNKGVDKDGR